MVQLIVDGREIRARQGEMVLQVCLREGIYIPHLCFLENETRPSANCRLCFVQVEGEAMPVTACSRPVAQGMRIRTDTGAVRRLQRSALRLLLSAHDVDCKHCHANGACELQRLGRFLNIGLKIKKLDPQLKPVSVDSAHPHIDHFPNRCVLCGLCIKKCRTQNGFPLLTFIGRGFTTVIRYYESGWGRPTACPDCLACIEACPVGALKLRSANKPALQELGQT